MKEHAESASQTVRITFTVVADDQGRRYVKNVQHSTGWHILSRHWKPEELDDRANGDEWWEGGCAMKPEHASNGTTLVNAIDGVVSTIVKAVTETASRWG